MSGPYGGIRLTLIWRALKPVDQNYTVFTHVIDQLGKQIAGQDNQPVNGTYPTSRWMPGEYVIEAVSELDDDGIPPEQRSRRARYVVDELESAVEAARKARVVLDWTTHREPDDF